jgi:hypothetical protein
MRAAIVALLAAALLAPSAARAGPIEPTGQDQFGTSGIEFTAPTTVWFQFDATSLSTVALEVGVYDLTGVTPAPIPTQLSYEAPLAATLFGLPNGFPALGSTATFTFEPGHVYSLGIYFPNGYRGADWVYSTTALNGFYEQYSKNLGDAPTNQFAVFFPSGAESTTNIDSLHFWQFTSVDLAEVGRAIAAFGAEGDGQKAFVVLDVSVPEPGSATALLAGALLAARRTRRR